MLRLAALALAVARTYCAPDAAKVAEVETAIAATRSKLLAIYGEGVEAALLRQGVEFLDDEHGRGKVVERLLRAFALGDSFVIAVGGMSDVAGHGLCGNQPAKSIRLIFGRIDCSQRVLEARRKCSCQNIRIRAH